MAIKVTINYLYPFNEITSRQRESRNIEGGTTFSELIATLFQVYGKELEQGNVSQSDPAIFMILNDEVLQKNDMDLILNDKDIITIGMVVAGG